LAIPAVEERPVDDQVIERTETPPAEPAAPAGDEVLATAVVHPGAVTFPRLLAAMREARSWSKADLAKRADLDPSTITRLEQGSRKPDRETVVQLAEAMALPVADRDRLLAAGGYRSDTWDDPELIEIAALLADPSIAPPVRHDIRTMLRVAISHGRMARAGLDRTSP
jgi:transcriptional regulator with XRE-family HTH domain